jgi:hypothetical protein
MVSVWGWLPPGSCIVDAWYDGSQFVSEWYLWVDGNGNGAVTLTHNSDHPNAFIVNLTSTTNNALIGSNVTALNDSSTTKDLTFGGNETKTVWVRLPKESTVLGAEMKLDIKPLNCTAWDDTEDYWSWSDGPFDSNHPPSHAVDENWSTYAQVNPQSAWYFSLGWINESYILPNPWDEVNEIQWQIKVNSWVAPYFWNYTANDSTLIDVINRDTYRYDPNYSRNITYIVKPHDFIREGQTFNVSTLIGAIRFLDWGPWPGAYYEGQVRWGVGSVPTNPFISVGNDSSIEWYHSGEFNDSETISNLSTAINEYISNATAGPNEFVDVPISLHSDTAGIISISDINIAHEYNTAYLYNVSFVAPLSGYSVNYTPYSNPVEVCIRGFFINSESTLAKIDGVQCPVGEYEGEKYVEFIELIPSGLARPWGNHTVWWDSLSTPSVEILSPQNKTYNTNSIDLNFTVNEPITWAGYSLDEQEFQTITGNTTLNIPDGFHNIIVNVTDNSGQSGTSERVFFTVSTHDIAVMSVSSSRAEAIMGQVVNITVRVKNEGIHIENFNITTYYDDNDIQTRKVTDLAPGNQVDLTFNWNTIGTPVDTYYTIKAQASIVTNETDLVDNTLTNGTVVIRTLKTIEAIPCDHAGNPKISFETGSISYFKVKIDDTALEPASLQMTINIYDSNNTVIGVASFQGSITSGVSTFIVGTPIPSSAHLGNATVYANAYTDWPHNGGIPYCPETSAIFQIIGP